MYKVNDVELKYRMENNDGSMKDCDIIMYLLKQCYNEVEQHIDKKTWQDSFEWNYNKFIDDFVIFRMYGEFDGGYPMEMVRYRVQIFYDLCNRNKILVESKVENNRCKLKLTKINKSDETKLHIYKLVRHEPIGYDTYDSCVVCAENEEAAMNILPWGKTFQEEMDEEAIKWEWTPYKENISCEYIGEATGCKTPGVILSSYNAG